MSFIRTLISFFRSVLHISVTEVHLSSALVYLFYSIIIALIFTESCADKSEIDTMEAQQNLELGWEQYNAGKYTKAILSFERSINLDESLADAYNGLGWARLSVSQNTALDLTVIEEAKSAFFEAIKRNDKNADAWIGLANTLFLRRTSRSDFKKAIEAVDFAMQADQELLYRHDYKSEADLHALKSACYYYLNDKESARTEMRITLEIDSQNRTGLSLQQILESTTSP